MDSAHTQAEVLQRITKFNTDRSWGQFHTPANLAKSIVLEAAELLENFQWSEDDYEETAVQQELADVLIYAYQFALRMEWDVNTIMLEKLDLNEQKYPVEKSKGKSLKYTELE